MAGSYNHAVADDGQLYRPEDFVRMVENLGDAYETVEEMYGMIWYLADQLAVTEPGLSRVDLVWTARRFYREGLEQSPGTDGRLADEDLEP